VLCGEEQGAHRDALLLGAALALEATGIEAAPRLAVARAAQAIDSGSAAKLLAQLADFGAQRGTGAPVGARVTS